MSHDEFTKLFKYMQQEFDKVHAKLALHDEKFDQIYGLVDADLKAKETDEQERLIIGHQIDRQTGWIKQLAAKTRIKLVPEP